MHDQKAQEDGSKRAVFADSAYRSHERESQLAGAGIASRICEKGKRNCSLTDAQKAMNRVKSKVRARVEYVFGAPAQMGGHIVRTIGFLRARFKIGMMNLLYNMVRLTQLHRRDRKVAPAVRHKAEKKAGRTRQNCRKNRLKSCRKNIESG